MNCLNCQSFICLLGAGYNGIFYCRGGLVIFYGPNYIYFVKGLGMVEKFKLLLEYAKIQSDLGCYNNAKIHEDSAMSLFEGCESDLSDMQEAYENYKGSK